MRRQTLAIVISSQLGFGVPIATAQEQLVGTYAEARTTLAFKIHHSVAQTMLPHGWIANQFSAGPSKGANLVVTFMDWLAVQEPDGKPGKTFRHVGVTVPAKQDGSQAAVSMVVAGLSAPPGYAPGPYGNFVAAQSHISRSLRTDDDGASTVEESWLFSGENGDAVDLQLQFGRGLVPMTKLEAKVYSSAKPQFYRIYRIEEAIDVIRSADVGAERVQKYMFKATGPRFSTLFNGSEELVSIASFPWFFRKAFLPAAEAAAQPK
jgi:hypothetical protein